MMRLALWVNNTPACQISIQSGNARLSYNNLTTSNFGTTANLKLTESGFYPFCSLGTQSARAYQNSTKSGNTRLSYCEVDKFSMPVFLRMQICTPIFSEVGDYTPNLGMTYINCLRSTSLIRFQILRLSKETVIKNWGQILDFFLTPVKTMGGMGNMSDSILQIQPRTQPLVVFDGDSCTDWEIRGLAKKAQLQFIKAFPQAA